MSKPKKKRNKPYQGARITKAPWYWVHMPFLDEEVNGKELQLAIWLKTLRDGSLNLESMLRIHSSYRAARALVCHSHEFTEHLDLIDAGIQATEDAMHRLNEGRPLLNATVVQIERTGEIVVQLLPLFDRSENYFAFEEDLRARGDLDNLKTCDRVMIQNFFEHRNGRMVKAAKHKTNLNLIDAS